jgi:hypothetical protein
MVYCDNLLRLNCRVTTLIHIVFILAVQNTEMNDFCNTILNQYCTKNASIPVLTKQYVHWGCRYNKSVLSCFVVFERFFVTNLLEMDRYKYMVIIDIV